MSTAQAALIVVSDEDLVGPLVQLLDAHGATASSSSRRNLDGAAVTSWLVIAGVAIQAAPDILRALTEFLTRHRVHRIEFNGVVVENPRPEDVDEIMKRLPGESEPPPA